MQTTDNIFRKDQPPKQVDYGYSNSGGAADQLQERHLRAQYLANQLSAEGELLYEERYGDPVENEAREQRLADLHASQQLAAINKK